jgi:hypothetical protein
VTFAAPGLALLVTINRVNGIDEVEKESRGCWTDWVIFTKASTPGAFGTGPSPFAAILLALQLGMVMLVALRAPWRTGFIVYAFLTARRFT